MEIVHKPTVGIELDGHLLTWGTERHDLRNALNEPFKEINLVQKIGGYLPDLDDLVVRKDVYRNYRDRGISFTLIYDKDDIFSEFELQEGETLLVGDVKLDFRKNVFDLVAELERKGYHPVELEGSDENILISSLLTNFASSDHLGGNGKQVAYIYCSVNIDHLLEDAD